MDSRKKKTVFTGLIMILCVPVVMAGSLIYGNSHYYIPAVTVLVLTALPFLFSFKKRKPQAMEFIVLIVLCAIGIAFRALFREVPAFKPMTGIIIITGIAFGPEAGLFTGSMSIFLSNYIFGHGPWTSWQMVAFGFAGFLSGILFRKESKFKDNNLWIAFYGYALVQLVVGPFLDVYTWFSNIGIPTNTTLIDLLKSGFSYNMVHGVATFLIIAIAYHAIMDKLERIKIKYGLMEDEQKSFEDIFGEDNIQNADAEESVSCEDSPSGGE